jgi:hypothetical protein
MIIGVLFIVAIVAMIAWSASSELRSGVQRRGRRRRGRGGHDSGAGWPVTFAGGDAGSSGDDGGSDSSSSCGGGSGCGGGSS